MRTLWTTGAVSFHGKHFNYDNVAFTSGTEMAPLAPVQQPPPIWVVSNPRLLTAPGRAMAEGFTAALRAEQSLIDYLEQT